MSFSEQTLDLLTAGQYEEAKKKFAWALRKDDDEMVHSLAEELAALGFTNMAKRAYEKLLERYPDEDELRVDLAELAVSAGDDDQALDCSRCWRQRTYTRRRGCLKWRNKSSWRRCDWRRTNRSFSLP